MVIKLFFTILISFTALVVSATDISFVVYNVTGTVSKNSAQRLKKGDKVLANESIVLANKASIILVCSNYKIIQLNKKGSYTAKNLQSQCSNTAAGYSSAYFKYVWNEFTHPHGKPETNPGEYMKNIGAASRGCNTVSTGIVVDTIHYFKGALPVYWNSAFTTSSFKLYDVPVDGGPLQKIVLEKDQPIQFEKIASALPPGEYYWNITDEEGNGCERNYLKLWDESSYRQRIEELKESIPVTTPAETAFATGFVLQQHYFIAEAIAYYRQAATLEPSNNIYQKTLSSFYATQF